MKNAHSSFLPKVDSLGTLRENWINKVRHTPYRTKNEDQFFRGEVYKEYNYSLFTHVADWNRTSKFFLIFYASPAPFLT